MTSLLQNNLCYQLANVDSSEALSKIAVSARQGLNSEPKSFENLNHLIKFLHHEQPACSFDHFYSKACKVLTGEAFQDLPGPLRRLIPLATNYIQSLHPVETALTSEPLSRENIDHALSCFTKAHSAFKEIFTFECENASPGAAFTVLNRYPNSLRLYFMAFLSQLSVVPPGIYMSWKESIESMSEEVVDLFPRLAIHYLLEKPQYHIPELFIDHRNEITAMRTRYNLLSAAQKSKLLEKIFQASVPNEQHEDTPTVQPETDPTVHELFLLIGELCSKIQVANRIVFNGVVRLIYQESAKVFALLDHMNIKELPRTPKINFRALFLSLLKQDALNANELPFEFRGSNTYGNIQEETLTAYAKYQALSLTEKEDFDILFIRGDESVGDNSKFNDLIRKSDKVNELSSSRPIFSLYGLPALSYRRNQ